MHSHITYPFFRSSAGFNATSLPKRWPLMLAAFLPAHSLGQQPQDDLRPFLRSLLLAIAVFPQSQMHAHITYPFFRSSAGFNATSLPNRWPLISLILLLHRHPSPITKSCTTGVYNRF